MAIQDDLFRMEAELHQWDDEIVRLTYDAEAEAQKAHDRVKGEYQKRIDALKQQKDETAKRLEDIKKINPERVGV